MQETYTDLEKKNSKDEMYSWVTHWNPFRGCYEGVKRENINELWSGDKGNVIRATTYSALEEIIIKTGGDKEKLKQLTK